MNITLPAPVQGYIAASNAIDGDALIECFADDAFVNDARREFWGKPAIRAWLDREVIGDKVTMDVTATSAHYGDIAVDAVMDGDYDKTGLPSPLVLTPLLHAPRRPHRPADHHPQRADTSVGSALRNARAMPGGYPDPGLFVTAGGTLPTT
jgi:hypothetical protein